MVNEFKIEIGENMNAFKRFNFDDTLLKAIDDIHFTHPTMVQERVIPKVISGKNVIAQSATGSGKSHAFLLPIISKIVQDDKSTQAIILAPTRELARQINQMTKDLLVSFPEIEAKVFVGGTELERDLRRADSQPHIVIGTPTRVKSLIDNSVLKVSDTKMIVIDEADLMIDLGFLEQIDQVSNAINSDAQFLIFSATIPEQLQTFLKKYVGNTEVIVIDTPKNKTSIHYSLIPVKGQDKKDKILKITKSVTPYIGIIFANSRERADELFEYLLENGINVGLFHGGLKPRERQKEIKKIENLEYHWVIASDLASRGLDFDGASHVINYDIPKEIEFFTHRVGRVGRGQYSGVAITLYTPDEQHLVDILEQKGYKFVHEDLIRGELKEIKDRKKRTNRSKQQASLDQDLSYKVRKPKKVKPGYKKKMQVKLQKLEREERKKHAVRTKRQNRKQR